VEPYERGASGLDRAVQREQLYRKMLRANWSLNRRSGDGGNRPCSE